jgi:hypothetical protein
MSLEYMLCPQIVDFTRNETFDMDDGANYLFGEKIAEKERRKFTFFK